MEDRWNEVLKRSKVWKETPESLKKRRKSRKKENEKVLQSIEKEKSYSDDAINGKSSTEIVVNEKVERPVVTFIFWFKGSRSIKTLEPSGSFLRIS